MIETIKKVKYRINHKKVVLTTILFLLLFLFSWGIKATYAYYDSKSAFSFLGTTIGDFDIGDGDINLILYMEDDDGEYNLTKSIPSIGYYLNNLKTDCSNENTTISYDNENNTISISSNEKTTCRIYFDQLGESDVRAYILLEDDYGDYSYNGTNYKLSNIVPEVGYEYLDYSCINEDAVTNIEYDSSTMEFSYSSTEKNICYVYYKALSNKDLTLNIYIQETDGSETYRNVANIPTLNNYVLNTSKSSCLDLEGNNLNAEISYSNRQISVDASNAGVCNVYLDISN